jgi:hypothetical protein
MSRRRPTTFTVVKDVVLFLLGIFLILYQALIVPPADFNLSLVILGGALVGVPGAAQLWAPRTGGTPSEPPLRESPPRSQRSSASGSEADRGG